MSNSIFAMRHRPERGVCSRCNQEGAVRAVVQRIHNAADYRPLTDTDIPPPSPVRYLCHACIERIDSAVKEGMLREFKNRSNWYMYGTELCSDPDLAVPVATSREPVTGRKG